MTMHQLGSFPTLSLDDDIMAFLYRSRIQFDLKIESWNDYAKTKNTLKKLQYMKRNQENDQENIQVMDKEEILQKLPKNVNLFTVNE